MLCGTCLGAEGLTYKNEGLPGPSWSFLSLQTCSWTGEKGRFCRLIVMESAWACLSWVGVPLGLGGLGGLGTLGGEAGDHRPRPDSATSTEGLLSVPWFPVLCTELLSWPQASEGGREHSRRPNRTRVKDLGLQSGHGCESFLCQGHSSLAVRLQASDTASLSLNIPICKQCPRHRLSVRVK